MRGTLLALCLLGTSAAAETPLTAEAFETLTEGRTLTWAEFGQVYGVEEYLPGRRVRWASEDDGCLLGSWYPEGAAICFLYEDRTDPVCWQIGETATGLSARHIGGPPDRAPVILEESPTPLLCLGPEVGA